MELVARERQAGSESSQESAPLFARLHPRTARCLHDLALASSLEKISNLPITKSTNSPPSCWSAAEDGFLTGDVEFLPLEITLSSACSLNKNNKTKEEDNDRLSKTIYVSYNGGSVNEESVIELHPTLLNHLDPTRHSKDLTLSVRVQPMHRVQNATRIHVEPLSSADWEILEVDANYFEGGGLLSQVSVVFPGQILPLVVHHNEGKTGRQHSTMATIRVLADDTTTTTKVNAIARHCHDNYGNDDDEDSIMRFWYTHDDACAYKRPNDDKSGLVQTKEETTSEKNQNLPKWQDSCLRLVADTEVVVTPKPRTPSRGDDETKEAADQNYPPSGPLRVHPIRDDYADEMYDFFLSSEPAAKAIDRTLSDPHVCLPSECSPPPCSILVHPLTLANHVPGWKDVATTTTMMGIDDDDDDDRSTLSSSSHMPTLDSNFDVFASVPLAAIWKWEQSASLLSPVAFQEEDKDDIDGEHDTDFSRVSSTSTIVRVFPSNEVPHGSVVIDKDIRYQMNLSPLYDAVCMQLLTKEAIDRTTNDLQSGCRNNAMRIELIPVHLEPRTLNPGRPWRCPDSVYRFIFKGSPSYPSSSMHGSVDVRSSTSFAAVSIVRSMLSSWVGSSGNTESMPLCSGSIVRFAVNSGGTRDSISLSSAQADSVPYQVWIVPSNQTSSSAKEDADDVADSRSTFGGPCTFPPFIFAYHLPDLILSSTVSDDDIERTPSMTYTRRPQFEHMLHLLPSWLFTQLPASYSPLFSETEVGDLMITNDDNDDGNKNAFDFLLDGPVMITGESGAGKTHYALSEAAQLRVRNAVAVMYLDCKKLQALTLRMNDLLLELTSVYREAQRCRPSIVILDDLDSIVPNILSPETGEDGSHNQQQVNPTMINQVKLLSDQLRWLIHETTVGPFKSQNVPSLNHFDDESNKNELGVSTWCTCQNEESIIETLRSFDLFANVVAVPRLDTDQRSLVFENMVNSHRFENLPYESVLEREIHKVRIPTEMSKLTDGYRPRDLEIVAARVVNDVRVSFDLDPLLAYEEGIISEKGSSLIGSHLLRVVGTYVPISRQLLGLTSNSNAVKWSSVGGLFSAKKTLTDVILHPMRYQLIYKRSPIKLPRGILLFGPPGCGKTFLVPPLASECNLSLIVCRGPEILDKYIGASEAKVRHLFARAYAAAPALLFFDDFDALAPKRGSDNTGVTDRVVNQLLTFLDGVEDAKEKTGPVFIVGASSRPDKIDPALLRPGRLEKHVHVGFPENEAEWNNIFAAVSRKRPLADDAKDLISKGNLLKRLGKEKNSDVKKFSAADMKAVFDTAQLNAAHEFLAEHGDGSSQKPGSSSSDEGEPQVVKIRAIHLMDALNSTRPSLSMNDRNELFDVYKQFHGSNNSPRIVGSGQFSEDGQATKGTRRVGGYDDGSSSPTKKIPVLRTTLR